MSRLPKFKPQKNWDTSQKVGPICIQNLLFRKKHQQFFERRHLVNFCKIFLRTTLLPCWRPSKKLLMKLMWIEVLQTLKHKIIFFFSPLKTYSDLSMPCIFLSIVNLLLTQQYELQRKSFRMAGTCDRCAKTQATVVRRGLGYCSQCCRCPFSKSNQH